MQLPDLGYELVVLLTKYDIFNMDSGVAGDSYDKKVKMMS